MILRKDLSRILETGFDRFDWSERMPTNQIYASRKTAFLISLSSDLTHELKQKFYMYNSKPIQIQ